MRPAGIAWDPMFTEPMDPPVPSSWYLTKIEHPHGDYITFSYESGFSTYMSGVSQTFLRRTEETKFAECVYTDGTIIRSPNYEDKTSAAIMSIDYMRVKEISASSFGKIKFTYEVPSDLEDMDGVLRYMELVDKNEQLVKKVEFSYEVEKGRPFLIKLSESGKTAEKPKEHFFSYNDLEQTPKRLSYSQDHFGYYNGKGNGGYFVEPDGSYKSHGYLVPLPATPSLRKLFDGKGGNREPDSNFSSIGLLSKVTYPTGGWNEIEYEGNDAHVTENIPEPLINAYARATGTDEAFDTYEPIIGTYGPFTVEERQEIEITAEFDNQNDTYDEDHHIMLVVYLSVDGVEEELARVEQDQSRKIITDFYPGKNYVVKVELIGYSGHFGRASFSYSPGSETVTHNKEFPGVRVKRIATYDAIKVEPEVKVFKYSYIDDLSKSSGRPLLYAQHNASFSNYFSNKRTAFRCQPDPNQFNAYLVYWNYIVLHSNSLTTSFSAAPNNILYSSVLVSNGENFENGGTEYTFNVESEVGAYPYIGEDITDVPYTVRGYDNALPLKENYFKMVNDEVVYTRKSENFYKIDSRIASQVISVFARKNYEMLFQYSPPREYDFEPFDVSVYHVNSKWNYIYKSETSDYDLNGQNPITRTDYYYYDNPQHALKTRVVTTDSKSNEVVVEKKYPQDVTAVGTEETARQGLIANYQLASLVEESTSRNGAMVKKQIKYKEFASGLYLPEEILANTGVDNAMEGRLEFRKYDVKGNISEVSKADGTPITYLWSYDYSYPIAKISNATYSEVEFALGGSAAMESLAASTELSQLQLEALGGLRDQLPGAMVTLYTYDPLVGVTSLTDPNGRTTYYEYDELGRLKAVKDHEGNLLKAHEYRYAGQ
ncbi:RHS repeat domain-containing protein [Pontibacter sp. H249]|uniref:RHS repeat domain-containing protein n=1 Tax=Pontibacter sp. H249 TaxID=3133420 RepID=UPI0030C066E5